MNNENRQKVFDYLNNRELVESITPLYFISCNDKNYKNINIFEDVEDVYSFVKKVLDLSRVCKSINSETDEYESGIDRWRSSIDIWRHIIHYKPEVKIFDVMHELYKYYHVKDGWGGQFCDDIKRRTFKSIRNNDAITQTNYMSPEYIISHHHVSFDEYKLNWEDWKDI